MSSLGSVSELATPPKQDARDAIIELIYAGHALAKRIGASPDRLTDCVCGVITSEPENPVNHATGCPVSRFYAAVDAVRKAAL